VKILFVARHLTYLRNFDAALEELVRAGHELHVVVEQHEEFGGTQIIDRLAAADPGRVRTSVSPLPAGPGYGLAVRLRFGIDYLRYLEPAYAETPRLKARARRKTPSGVVRLTETGAARRGPARRLLGRALSAVEQAIGPAPEVEALLREERPDVLLLTPLIGVVASPQLDYLYAARRLGIPTALCVWSWDHLSSKAIIRTLPDRVIVWNPTQAREARDLHQVPESRLAVTGAQCFDRWFDRSPSRPRAEFCARVGLPDDRPFVLWVCSSLFKGSPVEAEYVRRWIRALRESGHPELATCGILVRPHPSRLAEWETVDLTGDPNVSVWGSNPIAPESRADYFDSLHYSAAVAGLNTSAFIEGAIARRPVYAPLLPEYFDNQEGTIHFHYLLGGAVPAGEAPARPAAAGPDDNGDGLLHTSRSLEGHAAQLAAALRGEADLSRSRRFVEAFVRPHGLGEAATPRFVSAITSLPQVPRQDAPRPGPLARLGLALMRRFMATPRGRIWLADEASADKERRRQAKGPSRKLGKPAARSKEPAA